MRKCHVECLTWYITIMMLLSSDRETNCFHIYNTYMTFFCETISNQIFLDSEPEVNTFPMRTLLSVKTMDIWYLNICHGPESSADSFHQAHLINIYKVTGHDSCHTKC